MKTNLVKTMGIYAALAVGLCVTGCQPASNTSSNRDEAAQVVQIQSKRIAVKGAAKVVCEKEGCVHFDLHTVETNLDWINHYFNQRIQHTEPVAFSHGNNKNPKQATQADYLDQRSIEVRFVNQRAQLATFVLKSSNRPRRQADQFQQLEYINFDLKQKKRLALHQLLVSNSEQKLIDVVYQTNATELHQYKVNRQQLKLSDNYYFNEQGLVLLYPAAEFKQKRAGVVQLTVPYGKLKALIRPEYFSILQSESS
jgi:hypothetical protein